MQEAALEQLITADRLRSYRLATRSRAGALSLYEYEWNMRASASVMELTGVVEVFVRNALDSELHRLARRRQWSSWLDDLPLDTRGRADLAKARMRASRNGRRPEVHGRVVAELSFGFWRYLVESRYLTTLWTPALHRSFPLGDGDLLARQRRVRERLQQLHFVRNRAAHHEPIHARDLERDHDYAIELLGWISPVAAEWTAETTSLRGPRHPTQPLRCRIAGVRRNAVPRGAREHP
ncbi:hypothetical protein [Curtobacterium sp. NPDC089689]|uniref:hypothetical protein n=1 Tax=Curtobacterium sp. NPDC089689 TaxID=3363968 RepID=UPI00380CC671